MPRREKRNHTDELYEAISKLRTKEECMNFFRDLCSNNELLSMEQRYNVAKMLDEGKTYLDIQESTSASTATISRVGRMLSDGTGMLNDIIHRE